MNNNLEVLFSDSGIVVQCDGFSHSYDDARQAAEDALALLNGEDPSDWENNEPHVEWTDEQVRNGAYRVYAGQDLLTAAPVNAWHNEGDFFAALFLGFAGQPKGTQRNE